MNSVPPVPSAPQPRTDTVYGRPTPIEDYETAAGLEASKQRRNLYARRAACVALALVGIAGVKMTGWLDKAWEACGNLEDSMHNGLDIVGAPLGRLLDGTQAAGMNGIVSTQSFIEKVAHMPLLGQIAVGALTLGPIAAHAVYKGLSLDRPKPVRAQHGPDRFPVMPPGYSFADAQESAARLAESVQAFEDALTVETPRASASDQLCAAS